MKLQHYEINAGVALCRATHGAFLVDVRTPGEFHSGHIPGSVNLPLERLETAPLPGGPLFVYCRSGQRSRTACRVLASRGVERPQPTMNPLRSWPGHPQAPPRSRPAECHQL